MAREVNQTEQAEPTGSAAGAPPGGPADDAAIEAATLALGRELAGRSAGGAGVFRMGWASERMMTWAMSTPAFKAALFRLVDVFPATTGQADALTHMREYFSDPETPRLLRLGVGAAGRVPGGARLAAGVARHNIARMARQFIIGSDAAEVTARAGELWEAGKASTVDLLGEKTLNQAEADVYARRVLEITEGLADAAAAWPSRPLLDADDLGPVPRPSVSVKPTALSPHFQPMSAAAGLDEVEGRLEPILKAAAARGVLVWLDMEHYDVKDVTLQLLGRLAERPGLEDLQLGIVIQAYLQDADRDLTEVVERSAVRVTAGRPPLWVRLVKGAYWDAETIHAQAEGWSPPVWPSKPHTDAAYERLTRLLHDRHGAVRAAFGSHNVRSVAHAVSYARALGIPDHGYEIQMLYGMAEPMHDAVRRSGLRLRVYAPMGELVPGMSYLVRRLLENTANDSFVRLRFAEGADLDALLAPPAPGSPMPTSPPPAAHQTPARKTAAHKTAANQAAAHQAAAHQAAGPGGLPPYRHEPPVELRQGAARATFGRALEDLGAEIAGAARQVPLIIGGERAMTAATAPSLNPAHPSVVVAVEAMGSKADADAAVSAAANALSGWAGRPAAQRSGVLFGAASWLRARRAELAALEVLEAGKPWSEADGDIGEAIDFCEYYGRQMLDLAAGAPIESPPGERNRYAYRPKGVVAVVSPWNFPLAIPMGMVAAALVAGNTVVLKPAEQTPAIAAALYQALEAGGLPPGALNLLPGAGEVVGAHLVAHPAVAMVAFTGSLDVGLAINAAAAQRRPGQRAVKRVLAEMGGKNAIVVDADADLDQAVPGIVYSAFGFSGQKCSACSRVVVVDAVADTLIERLAGAIEGVVIGDPVRAETEVGPLIDADAQAKVRGYVDAAPGQGRVVVDRRDVPGEGFYVGPCLVDRVAPSAPIAREEIFGPVLSVLRVADFDQALAVANDTDFALTAGIYSRSPVHIALAGSALRAGNIYVNRHITGAIPGRHPFGGFGLSGVGAKAGGPDYLLQFLDPWAVSENTMRQGFAPDLG